MKIKQFFQLRLTNSELNNLALFMFFLCCLFVYNPIVYLATIIMITMSEFLIMVLDYCVSLGKQYMMLMRLEVQRR